MLLWMQLRMRLAFWAASAHCRIMSSFSSTRTPKSFLLILSPSLGSYLGLPWPSTFHFDLLNFRRFLWAYLSSLSRSLWMPSSPSVSICTTLLCVIGRLAKGASEMVMEPDNPYIICSFELEYIICKIKILAKEETVIRYCYEPLAKSHLHTSFQREQALLGRISK